MVVYATIIDSVSEKVCATKLSGTEFVFALLKFENNFTPSDPPVTSRLAV